MNRIIKRVFATLLVVLTMITSAPLSGFVGMKLPELVSPDFSSLFSSKASAANELAATGQCGNGVYWNYNNTTGELVISGNGAMWGGLFSDYDSPFYNNNNIKSIVIESGITYICDDAFSYCYNLQSVIISDSVIELGLRSFQGCHRLKTVEIGNEVNYIDFCAFRYCYDLESITIPENVNLIGNQAFAYCSNLKSIIVDNDNEYFCSDAYGVLFDKDKSSLFQYPIGSTRTSYVIPDSVTVIKGYSFCSCDSLQSIIIPNSVTVIGENAFSNCSNLTDVYYCGTEEQWKSISVDSNNNLLNNATIHYIKSEDIEPNPDFPENLPTGYKLRMRSDGAYSDSIAVGETISFWTFLYDGKNRLDCTRAYAISFDTPGIFEVVKTNKTSTSFDVTLKAQKAGMTNMTVSDSETGAYVTIRLKANNPIEVITMDEVKNFAKEYQKGRLTHFYDYNGLYVDGYSYRKNNDGSYNVSMNVYNEKAHHGAVVSYDKDGNIVDYELIDPQDKLPTSLWDGLFDSFDLVNAQLEKLTDKYLYDETALTKKTRIDDLNVPDGGYFVISNNYLENEYVFFANSINVAIDLICAYSKVNKIDVPDELPEKATEKVLEKIFKDLGPDQIKTVFKKLVKNFAKDLTISNVDVFMSGLVSTFDEFEINIEEIIKDTLEDLMTDTEAHLDFSEDIVLTLFGADAIKTALSSLGYINTGIKLIDVFSSSLAPEIVVYTPAEKDTVRISNGVTVTSETPLSSDYVLHSYIINESNDVIADAKPTVEALTSQYEIYDITLYKNSQVAQPEAKIKVMIPIPTGYNKDNIVVYWYKEDGILERMNAVVQGDYAVFETEHLSYYVISDETFKNSDFAKIKDGNLFISTGYSVNEILVQTEMGAFIKDKNGQRVLDGAFPGTNMTIVLVDSRSYTIVVLGDVDGDGAVSAVDARLALRASVGLENYTADSVQTKAAKVSNGDSLSAADARLILRASVGLEDPKSWMK